MTTQKKLVMIQPSPVTCQFVQWSHKQTPKPRTLGELLELYLSQNEKQTVEALQLPVTSAGPKGHATMESVALMNTIHRELHNATVDFGRDAEIRLTLIA